MILLHRIQAWRAAAALLALAAAAAVGFACSNTCDEIADHLCEICQGKAEQCADYREVMKGIKERELCDDYTQMLDRDVGTCGKPITANKNKRPPPGPGDGGEDGGG